MLRLDLAALVQAAVDRLVADGRLPAGLPLIELQDPKDPAHGDFATNFALVASKAAETNPRALAEAVAAALEGEKALASVEVAGPGFINLRLDPAWVADYVAKVLDAGVVGFVSQAEAGVSERHRINVEFVSVNPNGPITVGSGRGAAYGSTLANVLEAAGHTVHREYYINDGVNSEQMRLFAESVRAAGLGKEPPTGGYKGDYVKGVADRILANDEGLLAFQTGEALTKIAMMTELVSDPNRRGDLKNLLEDEMKRAMAVLTRLTEGEGSLHDRLPSDFRMMSHEEKVEAIRQISPQREPHEELRLMQPAVLQHVAQGLMLSAQRSDLAAFGTQFDTWFSEQSLHDSGAVDKEIAHLVAKGAADDRPLRHKLKLAKGGVIEDVEVEEQADEDEGERVDEVRAGLGSDQLESPDRTPSEPQPNITQTLWLRSTKFGDDMDRVLRRKDGRLTYIASDIAYHKDKFNRPHDADRLITILGPDHHGYIGRLHAVLAALDYEPFPTTEEHWESEGGRPNGPPPRLTDAEAKLYATPEERDACHAALERARKELEVLIFQLVRFVKDGKPAPMRKRDGNIYALIDLIDEIGRQVKPEAPLEEQRKSGKDVARFFYLMRSHDTTFDFDLDLAEKQSEENPVFYVQYAHARICSVMRKAEEAGLRPSPEGANLLVQPKETALILKIQDLPYEVSRCAQDYGVHRLTTYAIELARAYHHFYDACRVILPEQPDLSRARLALCEATRIALRGVFGLLGIEAPESM